MMFTLNHLLIVNTVLIVLIIVYLIYTKYYVQENLTLGSNLILQNIGNGKLETAAPTSSGVYFSNDGINVWYINVDTDSTQAWVSIDFWYGNGEYDQNFLGTTLAGNNYTGRRRAYTLVTVPGQSFRINGGWNHQVRKTLLLRTQKQ